MIDMSYLAYSGAAPQTTVGQEQDIVRDMALANPAERTATAANVGGGFGGVYSSESPLGYEGSDDKTISSALTAADASSYTPQTSMTGGETTASTGVNAVQQSSGYSPAALSYKQSSQESPVSQYAGLGVATAGVASHALDLAGKAFGSNFLTSLSNTLGKVGTVGSVLLNAYKIASGDVKGGVIGLGQTATTGAIKYAGTKTGTAALTSTLGTKVGGTLGSLASGVSIALPWYAAAKLGGVAINAVVNNNPSLRDTPLGALGEGLDEPLAVEQSVASIAARHGIGNEQVNTVVADLANPIGGAMKGVQSGDYKGALQAIGTHMAVPALPLLAPLLPFAGLIGGLGSKIGLGGGNDKSALDKYEDIIKSQMEQEANDKKLTGLLEKYSSASGISVDELRAMNPTLDDSILGITFANNKSSSGQSQSLAYLSALNPSQVISSTGGLSNDFYNLGLKSLIEESSSYQLSKLVSALSGTQSALSSSITSFLEKYKEPTTLETLLTRNPNLFRATG